MSKHSATPWNSFSLADGSYYIHDGRNTILIASKANRKENTERACACVNACAALSNPVSDIPALIAALHSIKEMADHGTVCTSDALSCLKTVGKLADSALVCLQA